MSQSASRPMMGRWRITGMELWDDEAINLHGPGYIQIDGAGGEMSFGAFQIGLVFELALEKRIWFTFQGREDGTAVAGEGEVDLNGDGSLSGEICFDNGDVSWFTAARGDRPSQARDGGEFG